MKAGHRAFRRLRLTLCDFIRLRDCMHDPCYTPAAEAGLQDEGGAPRLPAAAPGAGGVRLREGGHRQGRRQARRLHQVDHSGEANIYIPCNKMPKATLAFLSTCFCCYCFAVSHTQSQPVDSAYVDLAVRQAQAAQGAGVGAGGGRRRRCRRGDETLAALFAFQCVQVPACSSGSGQSHIGRLLHTDERFPAGNLFTIEIKQLCVNQDDEEDVGENVLIAERTVDRQILDAIIDAGAALPKTYQEICWDSCCKSKLCKEQVEPSDRP